MLKQTQIKARLELIDSALYMYNDIFRAGYKMALQDVLEIKRPKASPSDNSRKTQSAMDKCKQCGAPREIHLSLYKHKFKEAD